MNLADFPMQGAARFGLMKASDGNEKGRCFELAVPRDGERIIRWWSQLVALGTEIDPARGGGMRSRTSRGRFFSPFQAPRAQTFSPTREAKQNFRDGCRAMLACKLLTEPSAMTPNSNGFGNLKTSGTIGRRPARNQLRRQSKHRPLRAAHATDDEERRPAVGTLKRTRNLVLAALRVWELKQRVRE